MCKIFVWKATPKWFSPFPHLAVTASGGTCSPRNLSKLWLCLSPFPHLADAALGERVNPETSRSYDYSIARSPTWLWGHWGERVYPETLEVMTMPFCPFPNLAVAPSGGPRSARNISFFPFYLLVLSLPSPSLFVLCLFYSPLDVNAYLRLLSCWYLFAFC